MKNGKLSDRFWSRTNETKKKWFEVSRETAGLRSTRHAHLCNIRNHCTYSHKHTHTYTHIQTSTLTRTHTHRTQSHTYTPHLLGIGLAVSRACVLCLVWLVGCQNRAPLDRELAGAEGMFARVVVVF